MSPYTPVSTFRMFDTILNCMHRLYFYQGLTATSRRKSQLIIRLGATQNFRETTMSRFGKKTKIFRVRTVQTENKMTLKTSLHYHPSGTGPAQVTCSLDVVVAKCKVLKRDYLKK